MASNKDPLASVDTNRPSAPSLLVTVEIAEQYIARSKGNSAQAQGTSAPLLPSGLQSSDRAKSFPIPPVPTHRHSQDELRQAHARIHGLDELCKTQQRELQATKAKHIAEVTELQSHIQHGSEQLNALQERLNDLQEQALASAEDARWAAEPVIDTTRRLANLFRRVGQWVEGNCPTYSLPQQQHDRDEWRMMEQRKKEASVLRKRLYQIYRIPKDEAPEDLLTMFNIGPPGTPIDEVALLLLTSLVAMQIAGRVLGNPFFAVSDDGTSHDSAAHSLDTLYTFLKNDDPLSAELWRCKRMRGLDTAFPEAVRCQDRSESDAIVNFRVASDQLADTCSKLLMPYMTCSPEAARKLSDICKEACRISWQLWTDDAAVKVYNRDDMLDLLGDDQIQYRADSDWLSAHPLHNIDLHPPNERSLDNAVVQLICQPAISAVTRREDGQSEEIVLLKAVAWLGSGRPTVARA